MYLKARTHSTRVQKLSCKIKNQNLACPPLTARHKGGCQPPLSSLGNQDPAEDGLAVAVELLKKVKKEKISGSFLFIFFFCPKTFKHSSLHKTRSKWSALVLINEILQLWHLPGNKREILMSSRCKMVSIFVDWSPSLGRNLFAERFLTSRARQCLACFEIMK